MAVGRRGACRTGGRRRVEQGCTGVGVLGWYQEVVPGVVLPGYLADMPLDVLTGPWP